MRMSPKSSPHPQPRPGAESDRPDFSATTVSMNMADYQKLKKAEFAMKKEMERMAEMHWARTLELTEKLDTAERGRGFLGAQIDGYQQQRWADRKNYQELKERYDDLLSTDKSTTITKERKVVSKYLHEFADSVAKLKPDENLVMFGVYPGKKECDCGDSND